MRQFSLNNLNCFPQKFVDRTEIRNFIMNECEHKMQDSLYFKIIAIYGIGGIGKTKLIEKIKETISKSQYQRKVLHISFEIDKNRQVLDNLIKIRRTFGEKCCLFDYALLIYWDRNRSERLNDDFIKTLKNNMLTDIVDLLAPMAETALEIPDVPSLSNIFDFVNNVINKVSNYKFNSILKDIPGLSDSELLDTLPIYLGMDILRYLEKEDNKPTVFIFDSYQQSQPYSESQEWLLKLIGTIHKGLFLITGREELKWEDTNNDIVIYPLKAFPEEAARELLENYIPSNEQELLETIIESTECVPIYIDLAIKVYERELVNSPQTIVDKSLFTDRNLLVKQFINHMPLHWQAVLIDLSIVRIFNQDIFEYIVKDQQLPCPLTDYFEIVNVSLIDYQEDSGELIKLHDVFCKNGSKILSPQVKLKIFRSYLNYVSKRAVIDNSKLSRQAMVTLFLNILTLEKQLSKELSLEVTDWEQTLDMFFVLYDMKAQFIPPMPDPKFADDYNDILFLVSSINHKSISTFQSVQMFEAIKNPKIFGKHQKSYILLWKYSVSLLGKYDDWYTLLLNIKKELSNSDVGEWYDTRTKLYLADYWIMVGNFKKAYTALLDMKGYMSENYMSEDDALLICRYIGHMFRFNLFYDEAVSAYQDIFRHVQDSLSINVYIETNLCETYCYFYPEYVIDHFDEILSLAKQLKHIKNIGKLYYSRAIARTVLGDYLGAHQDIKESLKINNGDGYQSGELFAYMAQSYLDFAVDGIVQPNIQKRIMNLITQNNVYSYFLLPLFIMSNLPNKIEELRKKYEWLDFDHTIEQYNRFFDILRNPTQYH